MKRAWQAALGAATGYGVWRLVRLMAQSREAAAPSPAKRGPLAGRTILIVATDGFEESELVETRRRLAAEGARSVIAAPNPGWIRGMRHAERGARVRVDRRIAEVVADDFDVLVLPGGVANADTLRTNTRAVALVKRFAALGKPIAAICHAPWLLIEANVVAEQLVTSWPSLQTDLVNAGANWLDQTVVTDGVLITSRKPQDIPAFANQLVETLLRTRAAREQHARDEAQRHRAVGTMTR